MQRVEPCRCRRSQHPADRSRNLIHSFTGSNRWVSIAGRGDDAALGRGHGRCDVTASRAAAGSSLQVHAVRFRPGQELLGCLQAFVEERNLKAPFIITCVGSVTRAALRLANATSLNTNEVMHLSGRYEIVSLVGTLNRDAHLHVCLSDTEGKTVGGHALRLEVFTTAEVVIGEAVDLHFTREMDGGTGFPELVVEGRSQLDQ
ncbi:bifunctional protein GlmU-like [Aulostomus maculatus]